MCCFISVFNQAKIRIFFYLCVDMEQFDSKIIRNEAGVAALVFGLISGGYIFIEYGLFDFLAQHSWISTLLWAAKFVGLIALMRIYMIRFKESYEGVGAIELRRYGRQIAYYSALITALCSYLAISVLFPDVITNTINQVYETMGSMMDANSRQAIDMMEQNYGGLVLVSNLIWCTIYGCVLSAILSRSICGSSSPFDSDDDI